MTINGFNKNNLKATVDTLDAQVKKEAKDDKKASKDDADDKVHEAEVVMLANLKWSDTDNFYMNLGCHKGKIFMSNASSS